MILSSTGTGADALQIKSTAGGMDITSSGNLDITSASPINITTSASNSNITIINEERRRFRPFTYLETRTENSSGSEIRVVLTYSSREDQESNEELDERDIRLVMDQARVNRTEAETALTDANGDIVNAIMSFVSI